MAAITRLASLVKSAANEKKLKKANAKEYGSKNSKLLFFCHTLFYLSCLGEAILLNRHIKNISFWGLGLFVFSMVMLWIVIFNLKEMWTVKLIISPTQQINTSFFFKYFRHPNYFLNIIPELISVALICQAPVTLAIGLPLYCIPLRIRIIQEEKLMKMHFSNY